MLLLLFCDEKFEGKYQKRIWGIKNDCPNFNIRQSFAFLPTISLENEENVSFKFALYAFKLSRYDRKFSLNFLSLIARQIFSSFLNWNFLSPRLPIHSLCVSCFEPFNALRSIKCHFQTPLVHPPSWNYSQIFHFLQFFCVCSLRQFLWIFLLSSFSGSFHSLWDSLSVIKSCRLLAPFLSRIFLFFPNVIFFLTLWLYKRFSPIFQVF